MSMTMLENGEMIDEVTAADDDLVTCRDCGDEHEPDETIDGNNVCVDCYSEYYSCEDCGEPVHGDDTETVNGDQIVCRDCYSNYSECDSCNERISNDYTRAVGYDGIACDSCCDNGYAIYCDGCGDYYWEGDGPCCSRDCDCEAPGQDFSFPSNGGDDTIGNDERAHVSLAAGIISSEGMNKIYRLIRDTGNGIYNEAVTALRAEGRSAYDLPNDDEIFKIRDSWSLLGADILNEVIGNEWQNGNGNFTRRLRRHAYNTYKIALPDSIITEAGNVARAQSMGTDVAVEFTRDLNMDASDFYHSESCWWTDYSESRCSLKSNGGIGMRSFGEVEYEAYEYQMGPWAHGFGRHYTPVGKRTRHEVTGRAWVMPVRLGDEVEERWYDHNAGQWTTKPVRRWSPTFDSTTPDGYIVFNGYGALGDYAPARIVAEMTGMTYSKIDFSCDPMYVNNGGYLVTSKDTMDSLGENISINLNTDTHSNLYHSEVRNAA